MPASPPTWAPWPRWGGERGVAERYLLSRRSDIERELAQVAEVSPGTEAWSRLARRLALRASGEEVL